MHAILIHGMGRLPFAMSLLAARLWASDIRPHLFAYSVVFEHWGDCIQRLEKFITKRVEANEYIMIGHSLGTVLTRAVIPRLTHKPSACFLLAPPTRVCKTVRIFRHYRLVKFFGGECLQILSSEEFMDTLPSTGVPTKIYAGTGGPRGRYSPFGDEPNDGVLTVRETFLPGIPQQTVPVLHPFIMNSKALARDIVKVTRSLSPIRAK